MVAVDQLEVHTRGRGFTDITGAVGRVVQRSGIHVGLCSATISHTSASLVVCENAAPDVLHDLERFAARLVPDGDPLFRHVAEGPDDMPAHVRSVLTQTTVTLPVRDGALLLGTWQGLFLWEHRSRPGRRMLAITVLGEGA